ncbi:hypothetical protein SH1V18_36670 [Vallitalea longa]|uniref:Carrier domain-containing protein n=1 Tax=Vallitalea longa TaxID=2936439 RepID=A0A9W6DH44_9FIRM|nr:amino acid adenylation domain-containing protein [Vallitalea longa]GKX31187.1 hypothetical protein SH1V18_36670 [Vallitalea longa]
MYDIGKWYDLTHAQRRIWYIDKVYSNYQLHNLGGCLRIFGQINVEKLEKSINMVIQHNDALRLRFIERDEGHPIQYVSNFESDKIDFIDFSKCHQPRMEQKKWSEILFQARFNLLDNKLYHFSIFKINNYEYGIFLKIHHIIADGWSISLIQKQIIEYYNDLINELGNQFPIRPSYLDYIMYENDYINSTRYEKNKSFWTERFSNISNEFLYNTAESSVGKRKIFNIDKEFSNKIKQLITKKNYSLNTFFIGILLIYIYKITNGMDLIVGMPAHNRVGKQQKQMIGMFTNTLPFRYIIDPNFNIVELLKDINKQLRLSYINQKYPYDVLIKDLGISKKGYNSLFKMAVNYYNFDFHQDVNNMRFEVEEYYPGSQSYSLQLTINEWKNNKIALGIDYKIDEYSNQDIDNLYYGMIEIIKQVLSNENKRVKEISIISEEELNYKAYTFNETNSLYPKKTVIDLFEEQVKRVPNNIALEYNSEFISYDNLNKKANKLANYLRIKGVGTGSVVGILANHSFEMVIGILAILKSGGAYLPIDPSYPAERIKYMLNDSESKLLLTNMDVPEELHYHVGIVDIRDIDFSVYGHENSIYKGGFKDLAYIIYTSGSTGNPKGVMIEHSGLTNYIYWAKKMYIKDEKDVMPLYSSISFDLTVTSIFTPLISGSKIVIYGNDDDEFVLYKIIRENKVTVMKLTPSHLMLLKALDNQTSKVKRLIVGGEDLKVSLASEVSKSYGNNIEIYNEYGPTETVVGCMIYKFDELKDKGDSVPIGYPIDNVQIYILDENQNIVPTGVMGELHISGDGVARGYLHREQLNKEKFIVNPYNSDYRMYKTGDLARYLNDNTIEYCGRIDNQIKVRGHRIELAEIEKTILKLGEIKDTVVAIKEDENGNKVLNAYIVSSRIDGTSGIIAGLNKLLPRYMIPNNVIQIDKIPLTKNGKIDYDSLPIGKKVIKDIVKYQGYEEEALVKTMEEILGVNNISMTDNFYQLGGDSIKAIQISSRIKEKGLSLKVKEILSNETIHEIAQYVENNKITIDQGTVEGEINHTPIIEWFFDQRLYNSNHYNQYVVLDMERIIDIYKIEEATNRLVHHHDMLRTNFDEKMDTLYYNNEHLNNHITVDVYQVPQKKFENMDEPEQYLLKTAKTNFDLSRDILFNVSVFNIGHQRQIILFQAHHLVVDGVSWRIILSDFLSILDQLNKNESSNLPMKTHSFKEWAIHLHEYSKGDFKDELNYWKKIFNEDFCFTLDYDIQEDYLQKTSRLYSELNKNEVKELITKAKEIYNLEFKEVLIIALVLAIRTMTNKDNIVIEMESHGREDIMESLDVSRTVGWFTTMFPSYFRTDKNDLDSNIKSLKEQIRSIPNKGFNYGILKYIRHELTDLNHKLIRFNYLGDFDNIFIHDGRNIRNISFGLDSDDENRLTTLMDVSAAILNGKLEITFVYSENSFNESYVKGLMNAYLDSLRSILGECNSKVSNEFTPSDFDILDITQEELDSLFE